MAAAELEDSIKFMYRMKNAASVIVLGVFGCDGQACPPIFIENNEKVNSNIYIRLLGTKAMPWICNKYSGMPYIFQQNGAPCHMSKKTQQFLEANIDEFWTKAIWPPSSPDLNLLDHSISAEIAKTTCSKSHGSVESSKAAISSTWSKLSKDYIVNVCKAFRRRLEKVITAKGSHIEKCFEEYGSL